MAKKHPNTDRIPAQGGPVTAAIRAVREPVAPWFTPVRADDPMETGFYVARRWDWGSGRREVIWLDVRELDGEWSIGVSRCGAQKVEAPADWQFILRVGGIRRMPEELLIDLTATRH